VLVSTASARTGAVARQEIAFLRNGQIHFMNADGTAQRRTAMVGFPKWSRDGRWVLFFSQRTGRIYVARRDGSRRRAIARVPFEFGCGFGDWSPDGRKIAYELSNCEVDFTTLFVANRDGSAKRQLRPRSWNLGPMWAPRGKTILVVSNPAPHNKPWGMFTVNPRTGKSKRIAGASFDPNHMWSWSRDGRSIFVLAEEGGENTGGANGGPELFVIPASGGRLRKISPDTLKVLRFSLSPDNRMIAFHGAVGSRDLEIYVMGTDGTELRPLTDNQRIQDRDPKWSPDSRRIAFVTDRDGNREIYVMNADGSAPTNISRNLASDEEPSWIPPLR
jgi:Tol biopolymer transport system component